MHSTQQSNEVLRVANDVFFEEVKLHLTDKRDVLFTINGNSMRPFLSHGDKVLIKPIEKQELTYGKIILAKSSFGYVLHRLVWKSKKRIWLAGDNNLLQLEIVYLKDILGYVDYALIDGEERSVNNISQLFLAFIWFIIRPFRLLAFKAKNILNRK